MRMRLAVLPLFAATGCLTNTISGRWTGCDPGDQVYVRIPNDAADHFECERGGFELEAGVQGDFQIELERESGVDGHWINTVTIQLHDVNGDTDIGVVAL